MAQSRFLSPPPMPAPSGTFDDEAPLSHAPRLNRRGFLSCTAALGLAGLFSAESNATACEVGPLSDEARRSAARQMRMDMAQLSYEPAPADHSCNGDEEAYPARWGNFSKGLPHNTLGEVDPTAYQALLAALSSGRQEDFEAIPMGGGRKLTNPQAGLAYDLEGPDGHRLGQPPAPRLDSAEEAAEMVELYWMALLRDVPFSRFETHPLAAQAADELSRLSDFRGPKQNGRVTPTTLFRGFTPDDLTGPYLSQFLLKPISYGALTIEQKIRTVVGQNYLTDVNAWLQAQNGGDSGPDRYFPTPRYIHAMRDMGQYVHVDALYEAYLNACLILLGMNAPLDAGNPYRNSRTQIGFGTFGGPHILSLVTEVATRALKAVWFQKWYVHRRLRPEEFGGLVHHHRVKRAVYPLHPDILNASVLERIYRQYGTYLLPMAFPEGCPTHPAYGAGHATVAGACVTLLKAWFDESFALPDPVVPNEGGSALLPYRGPEADNLTVGGELNKVAANIAIGRNMAGVHWRSDYVQSVLLGEQIAIGLLQEQKATCNEPHAYTLTRFDGTTITL